MGRESEPYLHGTRAITVPFAQALLLPLLEARAELGEDGPAIVATECDPDSTETIDLVLRGSARVLLASDGSAWRLLGAEAQLRECLFHHAGRGSDH